MYYTGESNKPVEISSNTDADMATLNTTSNAITAGRHYHHTVDGNREGIDNLGNVLKMQNTFHVSFYQ